MVDSVTDCAESSSAASQWPRHKGGDGSESEGRTNKFNGGECDLEVESSDDAEDEDEEEAQEDGNKAVEWTEDDQKNLTDLGISEMERNKRLESLIARRRARKILSMQVRRTLMNTGSNEPCGQISSLLIPRSNPFPSNNSGEAQVSPTPGSAPSVLLPMHNPFDLPYDPQEEKPNLTGGSFQEEFLSVHQKDVMFCRHESFSLGAFFPGPGEFDQSRSETFYCPNFHTRQRVSEIPEYSRLRNQSGKEDPTKLIQTKPFQECKPMLHINSSHDHARQQSQASEQLLDLVDVHYEEDRSEVHTESNLVRDVTGGSSSSSSSEVTVPFSAASKDEILKSLSFSVPKNIAVDREFNAQRNELLCDGSPSSFGKKRSDECFFFADKGVNHTPTHSIASDLQVEVSEVSSPGLTIDGTISPSDGGSPIYDGDVDVEKETNSGNEEMWVASSQLSRVEENESTSREVHEVSEQDIIEVGFSRINQKSQDIVVSDMLQEEAVEQNSIDTSVSSSKIELPKSIQTHSTEINGEVHEVQPPSTSYSTENLASLTLENAQESSERSEAHSSHHCSSGKPEGRFDSPDKSSQEVNIISDVNDQVVFANDDKEILEFIKDTYGDAPVMVGQETPRDLSVLTTKNYIKTVKITEGNSGVSENDRSNSAECFEGEFIQQSLPASNLTGNKNIQDKKDEEGIAGVGSSGDNPNCIDSAGLVMQPEIVAEHGPTDSSSSSASTSVTEEKVPISQVSLSNLDQTTQIKVQQIIADVVDDNFYDRPLPESSNLIVSLDTLHLTEGSVTYLPNYRDPEKSLEPSNPPKNSTQELNSIYGVNDSEVPANDVMENMKTIDAIIGKAHLLAKEENSGVLSKMSEEESISKSIEGQTILKSYEPIVKNGNLKTLEDYEGEYLKLAECDNTPETSIPFENSNTLETSQECEQNLVEVGISEVSPSADGPIASVMLTGTVESGLAELNQSFISNPNQQDLFPEVVVEEVPIASSSSSSPKSVLQNKFSIDQASMLSSDQEMEENTMSNGLSAENLTAAVPQNALHSMEDSVASPSNSRYLGYLQESCSSPGKSTMEDHVNYINDDSASNEKDEKLNSKSVEDGEGQQKLLTKQEGLIDPTEMFDVTSIEGPGGGLQQMTDIGAVIGTLKPMEQNENSGTIKKIEKFEESLISQDVEDLSLPNNSIDNLEAFEVGESKSKNLTAHEANVVGLSEPVQKTDVSNIPVTSEEREEPAKADPGRSIVEEDTISNENELVVNVIVREDDLASSVGDSEAESQRLIRYVDVAEQSENDEANSSTVINDEDKSKKPTVAR